MNTQEKILKHRGDVIKLMMESVFIPTMKAKTKFYCPACGQDNNLFTENLELEEKVRDLRHQLDKALMKQMES